MYRNMVQKTLFQKSSRYYGSFREPSAISVLRFHVQGKSMNHLWSQSPQKQQKQLHSGEGHTTCTSRQERRAQTKKEGWELAALQVQGDQIHKKRRPMVVKKLSLSIGSHDFCGGWCEGLSLTCRHCRAKLCSGKPIRDAAWMMKIRSLAENGGQFSQERRMTWHNLPQISKNQRNREAWASPPEAEGSASFTCKPLRSDGLVCSDFGKA